MPLLVVKLIVGLVDVALVAVILAMAPLYRRKNRDGIVWGTDPLLNIKYWSQAMRASGHNSMTLVETIYPANDRSDFDVLIDEIVPAWIAPKLLRRLVAPYAATLFILGNAAMLVMPAKGAALSRRLSWRFEALIFRTAGVKTVVVPYGGDVWMYSKVLDASVLYGLLACYPAAARNERDVVRRVRYWERHADVIIGGFIVDGRGRWDVTVPNVLAIDLGSWKRTTERSSLDGRNGPVKIIHSPNHRAYKGTEFICDAVERLQAEGLQVELILLEKVSNSEVRAKMESADICADQCINTGYGLAAVEAMASGLPVIGNLELEARTRIFRRYAFLDECPIVSGPPEAIIDVLRELVTNPQLRAALGDAGRRYVEKYHSPEAAQFLFGKIYDRLVRGAEVDIMAPYHPLMSDYGQGLERIEPPLMENRLRAVPRQS